MALQVIGIDIGLSGAAALLNNRGLQAVVDLPTMSNGKATGQVKNQINGAALRALLQEWRTGHDTAEFLVVLEVTQGMPGQGSSSVYSLGHSAGLIEGVVVSLGLAYEKVGAHIWKRHFKLPRDKGAARAHAQRLYPEAPLTRVMDHNRAEAILMARYGHEKHA